MPFGLCYLKDKGITVDLVYIDPPFASGADYAKKVYLRRNPKVAEAIRQAESELDIEELRSFEEKMYGDIWNKESYLNWMYENLMAIKSIMSDTASIYVHLDWHIGHYVKILLDEVFGEDNFQREIIWDIQVLSGFKPLRQIGLEDMILFSIILKMKKEFLINLSSHIKKNILTLLTNKMRMEDGIWLLMGPKDTEMK